MKTALPSRDALRRRARRVAALLRREYGTPEFPQRDPLDVLIQTILSQKTTSESCRKAFEALKGQAGTWERARGMPVERIESLIRPAGLAGQKASWIKAILQKLKNDWGQVRLDYGSYKSYNGNRTKGTNRSYKGGVVLGPKESLEAYLLSLPGVGLKTARCVRLFALGEKVLPVDTHIARLARRLGLVAGDLSADQIAGELEGIVAPSDRPSFHVNGFLHGRSVCRARGPQCARCVITSECMYFHCSSGESDASHRTRFVGHRD